MPRRFVSDLKDGEVVDDVFLVSDKQLRANRNAALYLSIDLRDRSGLINGRMWNVSEDSCSGVQSGGYVRVRGKVQLFQGNLQLILTHCDPVSAAGIDPVDFEQMPSVKIEQLLDELRTIMLGFEDPCLRTLMECFLVDEALMNALTETPAGVKAHHAYAGGLLEHMVTLLRAAEKLCEVYTELNVELLQAGVFLHDIGKTRELSCESGFNYTDEGQLLGHLTIGVEMLSDKIRRVSELTSEPFPNELELRLKHMILSHHGTYEFGSPRLPMTPEAVALHMIDNLDAKLHEFHRAIQDDPNTGSHWTLFIPRLDRKIFKGATPTPPATNRRLLDSE
jgi:3'-5' exoribonuclease